MITPYNRTYKGKIGAMWASMNARQGVAPYYTNVKVLMTRYEFNEFIEKSNFKELYYQWVNSGFVRKLTPSIDRLDNKGNYDLGNIQIITTSENSKKAAKYNSDKTHCKKGHPFVEGNLDVYVFKKGRRSCRECRNSNIREYRKTHPVKNKEALKIYSKLWREKNKEWCQKKRRERWLRDKAKTLAPLSDELIQRV